jgi:hypothetical protein
MARERDMNVFHVCWLDISVKCHDLIVLIHVCEHLRMYSLYGKAPSAIPWIKRACALIFLSTHVCLFFSYAGNKLGSACRIDQKLARWTRSARRWTSSRIAFRRTLKVMQYDWDIEICGPCIHVCSAGSLASMGCICTVQMFLHACVFLARLPCEAGVLARMCVLLMFLYVCVCVLSWYPCILGCPVDSCKVRTSRAE